MESRSTGRHAPPQLLFDEIFATAEAPRWTRLQITDSDPVTIIYTSGTSGEAKGVVLTAANIGYMLGCTSGRLDTLMEGHAGQERVFHYLAALFRGIVDHAADLALTLAAW